MRTSLCVMAALGSVVTSLFISGIGCGSLPDDCGLRLRCPPVAGTGGSDSGTPSSCIPSEHAGPIGDDCGVFVSSSLGDDAGQGSKDKPLKSLGAAISAAKAEKKRVYACGEAFSGAVVVDAGLEIYGALDCAKDWSYNGGQTKTTLTADPDVIPLVMKPSTDDAKLFDFSIESPDSMAADGGSSIAVVADQAKATFTRCAIVAGNGTNGLPGDTPMTAWPMNGKDPDLIGNDGSNACSSGPATTPGAAPKDNKYCPVADGGPLGGNGGVGTSSVGGPGDLTIATAQTAKGGDGQPASDPMMTWSCATVGQGQNGTDGAPGVAGAGANGATSIGAIDAMGYHGVAGTAGTDAKPGQGGGGGGGAKGKVGVCGGASGGGGGAGGCGGHGGKGGSAGGASIGVISLAAQLTFDAVQIKVGHGGDGGNGGDGEYGGHGGNGGNGGAGLATSPACNGGNGGNGGQGGKGGGGRGGHAIGIAYTGTIMPEVKGVMFVKGTAGVGGLGADAATTGDPGVEAGVQVF